jgi:hypothetical protein
MGRAFDAITSRDTRGFQALRIPVSGSTVVIAAVEGV